jgi:hypothetical protein
MALAEAIFIGFRGPKAHLTYMEDGHSSEILNLLIGSPVSPGAVRSSLGIRAAAAL